MTSSRYKQITARVTVAALLTLIGFNALAQTGTYVFQYEVGFGGKHSHSNLYLGLESGFIPDAINFTQDGLIRIPVYSTDRKLWTLYRTLQPRTLSLALEGEPDPPSDGAPAAEDEPTQDSHLGTVGRILVAGGALGVLVYLAAKEERRDCTDAEKGLCIVGALAGGGGCGCKF